MWVQSGCRLWLCLPAFWRVHWSRGGQGFEASGPAGVGSGPLVLLLSALSLFPWCVACEYASISRFKGVFRGFYGVRVGLFVSRAFRGLCGFCVRE